MSDFLVRELERIKAKAKKRELERSKAKAEKAEAVVLKKLVADRAERKAIENVKELTDMLELEYGITPNDKDIRCFNEFFETLKRIIDSSNYDGCDSNGCNCE